MRVVEEGGHRLGRADADPGNAAQLRDGGRLLRLAGQLLLDPSPLAEESLDFLE